MADNAELKNLARIGKVESVDAAKMTARVRFDDKGGILSGPLHIIKRPVYVVPGEKDEAGSQTAATTIKFDYNQSLTEKSHSHKAYVTNWLPKIKEMVLCIMIADGDGDGFIIGGM